MHHADIAIQKFKIITFGRNARDGNRRKVYNIAQVDYSGFNERKNNNPTVLCVNQLNIRALEIPLDIPTHSNALLAVRNFNSDFSRPEKNRPVVLLLDPGGPIGLFPCPCIKQTWRTTNV